MNDGPRRRALKTAVLKKTLLLALLLVAALPGLNAQTLKVFYENKGPGYVLYASNPEFYPVSVSLELEVTNLRFSEAEGKILVVPPKSEKFKLGELTIRDYRGRCGFKYKYVTAKGDVTLTQFDSAFQYDLPFQKGKSFQVFQGYHGSRSHQNENALDITMPEGTEVLAARDGVVVQVVKNHTESCPSEECAKYNNYLTVMHPDGTFAMYAHIKYDGTPLAPGDAVKKGDVIAYSGNVGWSSGPHLHFVCFKGNFGKVSSFETLFKVDKGDVAIPLKEGNAYFRDY